MPNRDAHNKIAKLIFPNIDMAIIDEVNRKMDEPSQWMGSHHRVLHHSTDPAALDSLLITNGDTDRELVRQLHILLDYDKNLRRYLKIMGIMESDKDLL